MAQDIIIMIVIVNKLNMKNIKTVIALIVLCISTILTINAKKIKNADLSFETTTLAEQLYNRLNVSSSIVEFTNDYIDSKKKENQNVKESIWTEIKNNIDYNVFKTDVIKILNDNLTNQQMQRLIDEFANRPLIPIPNLKIKKEIADSINSFNIIIDQLISDFIR